MKLKCGGGLQRPGSPDEAASRVIPAEPVGAGSGSALLPLHHLDYRGCCRPAYEVYSSLTAWPCKGESLTSLGALEVEGAAGMGPAPALVMSWARPDLVLRMGGTLSQSMRSVIL